MSLTTVRCWFFLVLCLGLSDVLQAQAPPDPQVVRQPVYPSYAAFKNALTALASQPDTPARTQQIDAFWQQLREANQIPFAFGDSLAFLYRGPVTAVAWRGDFNRWEASSGVRLGDTDLWILERVFPATARFDYKVFRNNEEWLLDPFNPLVIWSGFGSNSELRMPAYAYPHHTIRQPDTPPGTLHENQTFSSKHLGYDVSYSVYIPTAGATDANLPVLYVADGQEYRADHLGSLVIILDELIAQQRILPVMAVFLDPREVGNPNNNRRADEYIANDDYVAFVAEELVPAIDATYPTDARPEARGMLGTSLGGLNAAYFGITRPDVFHKIAIQSPAFQVWPTIYDRYREMIYPDLQVFMTQGTLPNDGDGGSRLAAILKDRYTYRYIETPEGHSWGNWRALLDDMLVYFWPVTP